MYNYIHTHIDLYIFWDGASGETSYSGLTPKEHRETGFKTENQNYIHQLLNTA